MATLILKNTAGPDRVLQLHLGVNHFGRSPANDFIIEHPTISAFHCTVELTEQGVMVQDCDSTNGTFIDGEPVKEAKLKEGTTLQLGDVELFVESTEVHIEIPEVERPPVEPKRSVLTVKDRSDLCPEHPNRSLAYECPECQVTLCDDCVRLVPRRGKTVKVCPHCNQKVVSLEKDMPEPQTLFARLAKTIKLPFARRSAKRAGPPK